MGSIAGEIEDILRSIAIIHRIISVNPVVFYPPAGLSSPSSSLAIIPPVIVVIHLVSSLPRIGLI